jgi:hypothetical protein
MKRSPPAASGASRSGGRDQRLGKRRPFGLDVGGEGHDQSQ